MLLSALYQIAHLGDDDGEPEYSSAMQLEEGETFFFAPRPLKNLVLVDELESLSPVMACKVSGVTWYCVCIWLVTCERLLIWQQKTPLNCMWHVGGGPGQLFVFFGMV